MNRYCLFKKQKYFSIPGEIFVRFNLLFAGIAESLTFASKKSNGTHPA